MNLRLDLQPRLFVCDPTCINHYGHNLLSGKRFARCLERNLGLSVALCVSKLISAARVDHTIDEEPPLLPFFHHYWAREMPVSPECEKLDPALSSLASCSREDYLFLRQQLALDDLQRLIDEFAVGPGDTLFYPNIDYVSLCALCFLLHSRGAEAMPRLAIRFIGVLEYPSEGDVRSLQSLICQLAHAMSDGLKVQFSAESAPLARRLESLYGLSFSQTPTLSDVEYSPICLTDHAVVFMPGSGRQDKGFFRASSICRALSGLTSLPFTIYAQDMPTYRYEHLSPSSALPLDLPEVVMLPSKLSEDHLFALMKKARIVVLPYDCSVYRLRSSAIMSDSAHLGRFIVGSAGCGFSEDIVRFELGVLARSDYDFAQAIASYIESTSVSGVDSSRGSSSRRYRDFCEQSIVKSIASLLP